MLFWDMLTKKSNNKQNYARKEIVTKFSDLEKASNWFKASKSTLKESEALWKMQAKGIWLNQSVKSYQYRSAHIRNRSFLTKSWEKILITEIFVQTSSDCINLNKIQIISLSSRIKLNSVESNTE